MATEVGNPSILRFAQRWAELMEVEIASGKKMAEIADRTSDQADSEGITGSMHIYAISLLAKTWIYGEDLRRWHNLEDANP